MRQDSETHLLTTAPDHGLVRAVVAAAVVLCAVFLVGSASPASAATSRSGVAAVWQFTDGCVDTRISLESRTSGGTPTTYFFLDQEQTCDDPNSVSPVLTLEGSTTGGMLQTSSNLTAHLVTTIPVSCSAYATGACDQDPYSSDSVSLDLSWSTSGKLVRTREDGSNCFYRYGTATGSVLLGGVNLLGTDGTTRPADTSETNVHRCVG